jgi:hypothetical protein
MAARTSWTTDEIAATASALLRNMPAGERADGVRLLAELLHVKPQALDKPINLVQLDSQ